MLFLGDINCAKNAELCVIIERGEICNGKLICHGLALDCVGILDSAQCQKVQ